MYTQLHHLLSGTAERNGTSPALTYKDATLTYAELSELVDATGNGLRALGVRRGDRIGIYLDKRVETVAAAFGASVAGAIAVPVNPVLKAAQVGHIVSDCDVRVLVTTRERLTGLRDELDRCKSVESVVLVGGPAHGASDGGGSAHLPRVLSWETLVSAGGSELHGRAPRESRPVDLDPAAIFYTSGSTGRPKGVVVSHRNLIVGAESVGHYLGNTADDVILSVLALSFDAGFSQLTTGFRAGAHVVLTNYLLPGDVVRLCARHRVTGITGVPPLWNQLAAQRWTPEATEGLRYFANTGGRMPRATLTALRSHFPQASPYLMYGLTEAFRSTYLDPAEVDRRPDSIGKAIPNAEILVVRADGTECDPGEEGELVHRGPLVALGYWNDAERTRERFRVAPRRIGGVVTPDIAVWSGDTVVRDEEGFLYFVGRKDDMIKTSGYRVSPTEIEEAAYETGLVRDAVAVGIEDPQLGQHIGLVVTAPGGDTVDESRLLEALRAALPLYMVPRRIQVEHDLPRLSNGKFDRVALRTRLNAESGADPGATAGGEPGAVDAS